MPFKWVLFTNRFEELKKTYPVKDAAITALNQAFHTILTSGLILCVAGFLIGFVVSEPLISTLGTCLGRGVIISILSVILILPALMVTTGKPLDKTKFKLPENKLKKKAEIKNENKTTDK